MKPFSAFALALLAAGISMPVAARPAQVRNDHVWAEIAKLDRAVDRADARHTISSREAAGLHRQVSDLKQQYRRFAVNGLTGREANTLKARVHAIEARLNAERRDRDGRRG